MHHTDENIRIFTIKYRGCRVNAANVKPLEYEALLNCQPSPALTTDLFGSIHNPSGTGSFHISTTETEVECDSNISNECSTK